jgi:integrase
VDAPTPRRAQVQALTVEHSRALLSAAEGDRLEALLVLALTTGCRQGELVALHWSDVDLDSGVLQVRGTLHRVPGVSVGAKSGLVISDPKTSHSRRPVRLCALAVQSLKRHRLRQAEERLAMGDVWDHHDLVFTNSIGRPCEARNVIRKCYEPLLAKVGIPHLRLPRLKAGDSARLPLRCFRLQDQRFTVRGGLRPFRAVSSGPSTGRATPKRTPVAPLL